MTDIECAMVHYDGNNDEPYADLVVDALRQKREVDALAKEYGIDTKTMLTLAKSQIKTTKDNIELSEKLKAAIKDLHTLADKTGECYGCAFYNHETTNCESEEYKITCDTTPENNKWKWRGINNEN